MLQHFFCAVLLHFTQLAVGLVSTTWSSVYVNQSLLEIEPDHIKKIFAPSEIVCAVFATREDSAHLYCYENGQCRITELLREPSENINGMRAPVKCKTHFKKGDFPCATYLNNGYKWYGCVLKNGNPLTWKEARSYCQTLGMDLVSNELLTTAAQRQSIKDELALGTSLYFIGAHRPDPAKNQFQWVTGENLNGDDERWASNEPDYLYNGRKLLYIAMKSTEFYDVVPEKTLSSICGTPYP